MIILVGYDGTEICNKALALAKKHALAFKGEVIALTSLMVPDEIHEKEAANTLNTAAKIFDDGKVPFNGEILITGLHPGEDIVQFAKNKNVDEIIVGVKKRSKVGKMLFGSTLQNVVLNAHCPVVTVK